VSVEDILRLVVGSLDAVVAPPLGCEAESSHRWPTGRRFPLEYRALARLPMSATRHVTSFWEPAIAKRKSRPNGNGSDPRESSEANPLARELASIALVRMRQEGRLSVRQREGLRRAFATAAGLFGWVALEASTYESMEAATGDLLTLAERGAILLDGELAAELAEKQAETPRLKRVAEAISQLAEKGDGDFDEPVEVPYCHTAKEGAQRWVTKVAKLTLTSSAEAHEAARGIERNIDGWDKLRAEMVSELKGQQRELAEMRKTLPALLQSSRGLLSEVLSAPQ